jgi:2-polyprenyl-3-methyl-5-hydroxy-6-metoxy-1,4-benzoquinol methylase
VSTFDPRKAERFAARFSRALNDGALCLMAAIGHRTGLLDAMREQPPSTSVQIAERAGLNERYVREWLGSMAVSGIVSYDPATATFTLPAEHAACLTGPGSGNLARFSQLGTHVGTHVGAVAECFRAGGGVPYEAFRPEFTGVMDAANRNTFDEHLVTDFLPLVAGLARRLREGGRVADVGCGTGHALVVLAREFPASTFTGYDLAADAIECARKEAADAGLTNVRFERQDVAALDPNEPFDAVISIDTVHDLPDPAGFLRAVHRSLAPGGHYLMMEPKASSNLEDNIGHPMAPLLYAVSTLHCLTVSLAEGGAGLGTAFGEQKAIELLTEAGFTGITVTPAPGDPMGGVFVATRSAT